MEWDAWRPHYEAIVRAFGYDPAADRAAADLLHAMVPPLNRFRNVGVQVRNRRNLVIAGCGPGLERAPASLFVGNIVVAADGATERLQELGVPPQVVVTDLDGRADALRWAAESGSFMVVHAHGDNVDALRNLAPRLGPQIYGTFQCPPWPGCAPMANVGGFTDGDRAVLLAEHLGARAATLVGFEFDAAPSRYSNKWDPVTKPRKLAWAKRLVEEAHARGKIQLVSWLP